jgi:uncharacterized damage-inducible protein DinB
LIKQQFVERLVNERLNVFKATEGLSDEDLCKAMGEGKWSIKDTLGHLAAWEGEVVKAFEQKSRGERPTIGDIKDFDSWNTVEAGKRKDSSPGQIRGELNDTRKRLLAIIDALPDEGDVWSPERSTAKMLNVIVEHDKHHWNAICEYRRLDCA